MSAVVFYYRRSEFTTDSKFTIRSVFSTGGSFGLMYPRCIRTSLEMYQNLRGPNWGLFLYQRVPINGH